MGIWEAMEKLSELVDDSDPDVSVSDRHAPFNFGCSSRLCAQFVFPPPPTPSYHRRTTASPWYFDPVPIHSYSRSGRGFDLDSHVLTLTLLDDRFSN